MFRLSDAYSSNDVFSDSLDYATLVLKQYKTMSGIQDACAKYYGGFMVGTFEYFGLSGETDMWN